jgi:hypothetical protein
MIDPRIDAECDPDTHTWRVWQSICAQPQYHLTKCDPRAAWTLLLKHEAGDACDVLDQEHRFGLRQGDHGWVQVEGASAFGAFILEYGCELSFDIGWTTTKPGEDAHGGAKLRLVLEDGKLRGTYRASWGGSCSGEATGSVIGTRAGEHAEDADAGAQ